jgi:hypothetical protein
MRAISLLAVVLFVTHLVAQLPATRTSRTRLLDDSLNQRIDVDCVEMPLKDLFSLLQEKTGIQFLLKTKKLDEASVSPDTPITKSLKQVRLSTALDLLLNDLELTYIEKDGLILITTPEDAESNLEVRVYGCRDLLSIVKDADANPNSSPQRPAGILSEAQPSGTPQPGGGNMSPKPSPPKTKQELLLRVVTSNVASGSWAEGGGPGAITEYGGLIVITQTAEVHKQVERLFDMLREAGGLEVPKEGKVVR